MPFTSVVRKVDTVIIEMDASIAEAIYEILFLVQDDTRWAKSHYGSVINDMRVGLSDELRTPSPLYRAEAHEGFIHLTDRI